MKKKDMGTVEPLPVHRDLSEYLNEHPFIQWVTDNRNTVIYALLAFVILIVGLSWTLTRKSRQVGIDTIKAENELIAFQTEIFESGALPQHTFDSLKSILAKTPQLEAKLDGPIAQALLTINQVDEAKPFAKRTLKRTETSKLAVYNEFGHITLLISDKDYQNALDKSLKLQSQMTKENPLLAFNLIRIGMLQQTLGNKEDEMKTWKEIKQLAATNAPAYEKLEAVLEKGNISIMKYIDKRL